MKLKHLESALSSIQREFPSPKVELEQYPTSVNLAACVGLTALENGDIGEGMSSLDLGCGTGMLANCCALLGTDYVIAVDCDEEALQIANENARSLDLEDTIEMILAKVKIPPAKQSGNSKPFNSRQGGNKSKGGRGRGRGRGRQGRDGNNQQQSGPPIALELSSGIADDGLPLCSNCVDTVITNPPFGTKENAGMDVQFLRAAIRLARRAVYSFHKTSTRAYLLKTLGEEWGLEVKVVAEMKFDIPNMYKFHKKKSVDVDVDLIRVGLISVPSGGDGGKGDGSRRKDAPPETLATDLNDFKGSPNDSEEEEE